MILSYDFWKRRFGSDASVIGKTARVNGYPLTIIGVAGAAIPRHRGRNRAGSLRSHRDAFGGYRACRME